MHFARCLGCHTTRGTETPKGPSLARISNRYDRDYNVQSILKPSVVITPGYLTQVIELKNGETLVGFISSQGAERLELRDVAGTSVKVAIKDIAKPTQLKSSIMPAGLVNDLTVAEFAALLAYLKSLD